MPPEAAHNANTIPNVSFPRVLLFMTIVDGFGDELESGWGENLGKVEKKIALELGAARDKYAK